MLAFACTVKGVFVPTPACSHSRRTSMFSCVQLVMVPLLGSIVPRVPSLSLMEATPSLPTASINYCLNAVKPGL